MAQNLFHHPPVINYRDHAHGVLAYRAAERVREKLPIQKIKLASPHLCCRLVQMLIPPQELLFAINDKMRQDACTLAGEGLDEPLPEMIEFLDFVTDDRSIILESEDWPY